MREPSRRLVFVPDEEGLAPEEGRAIVEIGQPRLSEKSYYACGVLIIQDTLAAGKSADNVSVRIARLADEQFDTIAQATMGDWLATGAIGLADLLPDYDELATIAEEPIAAPLPGHAQQVEQAYVGQALARRQGERTVHRETGHAGTARPARPACNF